MDKDLQKLSGFCNSCSLMKPLDEIMFPHRRSLSDSKKKEIPEEFLKALSRNVDKCKETSVDASNRCLAVNGLDYSWHVKESPATRAFIEWKTMETSMEDGLLGRAAVSRTSSEHLPWGMSRGHADSLDNFPQFDSLHYGSRQDYKRRLRKASLIKELKGAASIQGSAPEFFEGISSKCLLEDPYPRSLKDDWLDPDCRVSQNERGTRQIEEYDEEKAVASNTPEIVYDESFAEGDDFAKSHNAPGSMNENLPCEENQSAETDSEKEIQGRRRRGGSFPPPLPSLMRKTSSLLPHKVPWVLLQPIRSKGRFILQEVQVASQMVFQPIRKDGRLLLRLFRHSNQNHEQSSSPAEPTDRGNVVAELRHDLEMKAKILTDVDDSMEQLNQIHDKEERHPDAGIAQESSRKLDPTETEPLQLEVCPSTAKDIEADCKSFSKLQRLGSEHLGVLQTMQQILFRTIQHHHDQEFHDELIRSFAARVLKLTLCRAALKNADKISGLDENPPNLTSQTRVNPVGKDDDIKYLASNYENYFKDELDLHDSALKLYQVSNMSNMRDGLDSQDPSIHQCRYKGNRRQGDEGLVAIWEAHCIAT